jgi:hypothetical protein
MTFGPDVVRYCMSSISTPFRAHVMATYVSPVKSNGSVVIATSTAYEHVSTSWIGVGDEWSVFTLSNITTITSALAIATPYRVAWQIGDLNAFPAAYVTSLAAKIGATAIPKASGGSDLPLETGESSQPKTSGLSASAIAGLGVSIAIGGALIAVALFVFWLRLRRKSGALNRASSKQESMNVPEIEDSSGNAERPTFFVGGKWRNETHAEVRALELEVPPQELGDTVRELEALAPELDSKTVQVVVEPVAELETPSSSHDSKEW